jgi:hypothetical protein
MAHHLYTRVLLSKRFRSSVNSVFSCTLVPLLERDCWQGQNKRPRGSNSSCRPPQMGQQRLSLSLSLFPISLSRSLSSLAQMGRPLEERAENEEKKVRKLFWRLLMTRECEQDVWLDSIRTVAFVALSDQCPLAIWGQPVLWQEHCPAHKDLKRFFA